MRLAPEIGRRSGAPVAPERRSSSVVALCRAVGTRLVWHVFVIFWVDAFVNEVVSLYVATSVSERVPRSFLKSRPDLGRIGPIASDIAKQWPKPGRVCPACGAKLAEFDLTWTRLASFGRHRPDFVEISPTLACIDPDFGDFAPTWNDHKSGTSSSQLPEFDPDSANLGPIPTNIGPKSANFCRIRPRVDQSKP